LYPRKYIRVERTRAYTTAWNNVADREVLPDNGATIFPSLSGTGRCNRNPGDNKTNNNTTGSINLT
tara:strand:- start:86 stop:283 length:198 start_codon:yes stop_codon:yes gene_type:complete